MDVEDLERSFLITIFVWLPSGMSFVTPVRGQLSSYLNSSFAAC